MATNDGWTDVENSASDDGWSDVPVGKVSPEEGGIWNTVADVGRGVIGGIPKIGGAALGGLDFMAGTAAGLFGDTESADTAFRQMEDRNRSIDQFNQENLPVNTLLGKIARGATQALGALNPVTAIPTMAGMTAEQIQGLQDQGVDPQTAGNVGKIQTVANVVLGRLGMGQAGGYLKEAGINVGTGGLANWLSEQYLKAKGQDVAAGQFDPTDAENWMVDLLASIIGVRAQKGAQAAQGAPRTPADAQAEAILAARQAPPEAGQVSSITPDGMGPEAPPSPYGDLPRLDTQELPPMLPMAEQGPVDVPAAPRMVEDQVPLLPETPLPQEGLPAPETPLPAIDPRLAGAEDAASILSLQEPSQYPQADTGVRHLDPTTGKVVQGMDADVPTIDFPLRQEVLQRPEVKGAITRFRKRAEEAATPAAKAKVEADFANYMSRYGITDAADAIGINRPLYETKMRDPMAIRKSGELNQSKSDMKGVPAATQNFIKAVSRKQGGKLDVSVFAEGFRRMANSLSKLTDQAWVKEKFPSDQYHTNEDGTPMILLHGTTGAFDKFKVGEQGVHMGFVVPSHLIRINEGEAYKPRTVGRTAINLHGGTYEGKEWNPKRGFNIRPNVLKAGNYPMLTNDLGLWSPSMMVTGVLRKDGKGGYSRLLDVLNEEAAKNGRPAITQDRYNKYRDIIKQLSETVDGEQKAAGMLTQLLKEAGIDGFFYQNTGETLKGRPTYKGAQVADPVSFVTWDPSRIESLYENKAVQDVQVKETSMEDWARAAKAMKQGGGINLSEITGGISDLYKRAKNIVSDPSQSTSKLAEPERQNAAAAKIPGMSGLENWISKDIPVETLKANILEDGDISNSLHSAIGSKEMIASIKGNSSIYGVGSYFTNARKRADLYHQEYIKPLEKSIVKLSQSDRAGLLTAAMKAEMFAKTKMTEAELRQMGLNDNEIGIYNSLRTEFDSALAAMNKYRESIGEDPISGHDAYLSSRWQGDWKTPVYDKEGRLVWYIAETSKAKADHALAWLAKNVPEVDVSKSKVEYAKDFFMTEESMQLAKYKDLVAMLGKNDPTVQALKGAYEAKVAQEGEAVLGHKKHMEPKAGIRGFLGDRPWVNDVQNTRDLLKSQLAYLRNTHTWVELQTAIKKANEIIADPEVIDAAPNLVELLQDIKKSEMGFSTNKAMSAIERASSKYASYGADALGKLFPPLKNLPTDLQSLNTGMGWAKTYFYLTKLGMFNIPFAAMSIAQPVFTVPHHVQLSGEGFKHNPAKTLASSIADGTRAFLDLALDKGTSLKGLQKDAFLYMKANAIGDLNQYSEAHDIGLPAAAKTVKEVGGLTMTESERFARSVAFMGYVSHLEQSGKFGGDKMALFQKAEELTNKSMANYRHTERAGMFNKMGFVGNAASTLNTFKVNQYNQMYDMAKTAKRTGDYKPLLSLMGMQMLMAGAMGFYAIDEAEDLYNFFKSGAVKAGWMKDKDFIEWSPKHAIAKNLPEWASYGLFSKAMGDRNFSSRMSAGNVVDLSFAGMFPFAADYGKQIGAAAEAANAFVTQSDDPATYGRALHALAPASLKAQVEMNPAFGLTDEQGNPFPTTKDSDHIMYRRTPEDVEAKSVPFYGMQTIQESKARDEDYRYKQSKSLVEQSKTIQAKKFEKAFLSGNKERAAKALSEFIDMGGDEKDLTNSVDETALKRMFTEEEWKMLKAQGVDAIMEVLKRKEFKGVR